MKTLDDFALRLRNLKRWAGMSYREIERVVQSRRADPSGLIPDKSYLAVIHSCFELNRKRLDVDLLMDILNILLDGHGSVDGWQAAYNVASGRADAATVVTVSNELPAEVRDFTGREAELNRLFALLRSAERGAVVISALQGMPGVGKTALASHAVRVLYERRVFQHVWSVNLRGFDPDPDQPPADPAAVLRQFLLLLGVPASAVPQKLQSRRSMYQKRLMGQRVLVLLDNAASVEQVRPLLPDSPGSFAVVTTRRSFVDLPDVERLELEVFTPDEALTFLRRAAGEDLIDADSATAAEIARLSGHLPLALALTAQRITDKGTEWSLPYHRDRLVERRRVRRLGNDVEVSFSLSYEDAASEHRRLLRLLSLHPGDDLDVYAAAALANADLPTIEQELNQLCTDHLVQQTSPGRYDLHDLIRIYATELAHDEDCRPDREAARTRCFDYYLGTAARAMDRCEPNERGRRRSIGDPTTPWPPLTTEEAALGWLDRERGNLIAAALHAAANGSPAHAVSLSETLSRYLDRGAHYRDGRTLHNCAAKASHGLDRANALIRLGIVCWRTADYAAAIKYLREALTTAETGDGPDAQATQARALNNLGILYDLTEQLDLALDCQDRALSLARRLGNKQGECHVLTALGNTCERLGRFTKAIDYHRQGRNLARKLKDEGTEAVALDGMGLACQGLKRYREALRHHERALAIAHGRDLATEGCILGNLGSANRGLEQFPDALDYYKRALAIFRQIGDTRSAAETRKNITEIRNRLS